MTKNNQEQSSCSVVERDVAANNRHAKIGILALVLAVVVSGGVGLVAGPKLLASETKEQKATSPRPAMPVETTEVRVADSVRQLIAVGTLHSQESVVIAAEIAGRIEKIGFSEGEDVKHNKELFQLDRAVLQAELDRAVASRNLSKSNYQRAENLLKDHAISQQERDEAYAKWQLDEANVRLGKARLDKTIIKAPFSGTLGLRHVSPGDYIQQGQPLVNLEATHQLKVEFSIPEKHISEVKTGQTIMLTSDAYPDQDFSAEVYAINPQVNEQSRSLVVRGLLDNSERRLFPGQFVKVQLSTSTKSNALFIPEQALIPQPKTKLVFKVVEGKAQMVPVVTGTRLRGWIEIVSGLSAGDVVVTGGHQKIGPGSPVHALPADPALFAKI
ncbi:MAG: efflux RND transporter periplasmic adaptor subunit [Desulfuromusa sp.]|jgi:membrane fusion protein (multidrug efflux system)|nr:efflux RND transporter periplasmic adaptor subunit [Desulfuromusa sp.]